MTRMHRTSIVLCICLAPTAAYADDAAPSWYQIPDAPALSILNAGDVTLDQPTSLAGAGAQVTSLIGTDGTVHPGVGFELTPLRLGLLSGVQYPAYRDNLALRAISRTGISVATTDLKDGEGTITGTQLGIGLRVGILDRSDPILGLYQARAHYMIEVVCKDKAPEEFEKCIDTATVNDADVEKWGKENHYETELPAWNKLGLDVAAATSVSLPGSTFADFAFADSALWLTFAAPIGNANTNDFTAQIQLGGRYLYSTGTDSDAVSLGTKVRFGSEAVRGSVEINGTDTLLRTGTSTLSGQGLGGVEAKLSDGLWLQFQAGVEGSAGGGSPALLTLTGLKWGSSPESTYD